MSYKQVSCDEKYAGKRPHAFIQWKGTDVCSDVYCICGKQGHIDGDFFYFWQCMDCGRVFEVGTHVPLIEITDEADKADVLADGRLKRDERPK